MRAATAGADIRSRTVAASLRNFATRVSQN